MIIKIIDPQYLMFKYKFMTKIDTLLPKKLSKNDASYKTVVDLNNALDVAKEQNIKNIALTGPFGSGKSSVLFTLMKDFDTEEREYLPISLATLQANDEHGVEDVNGWRIYMDKMQEGVITP